VTIVSGPLTLIDFALNQDAKNDFCWCGRRGREIGGETAGRRARRRLDFGGAP